MVVAVHGLGGSGRYWQGLSRALGQEFCVLAPDLGGFGSSDKPVLDYDSDFHVANLQAVVEALTGSERVALVGHSAGGVVAALWAAHNAERLTALALVASPFPAAAPSSRRDREDAHTRRADRRHLGYATLQAAWPLVTFPVRSRTFPRGVIRDYMRHTQLSYWSTLQGLLRAPGLDAALSRLEALRGVPCLLLNSPEDRTISPQSIERWAAALPRAERQLQAGGHQLLLRSKFEPLARWLRAVHPAKVLDSGE